MSHPFRHTHELCDACVEYEMALQEYEQLRAWLEHVDQSDTIPVAAILLRLPVIPAGSMLAQRRREGFFSHLRDLPVEPAGAARVQELLGKKKP